MTTYMAELQKALSALRIPLLQKIASSLADVVRREGRIFVCGNGGSAATASHFVCDLAKGVYLKSGTHVAAMALNDNVPLLTAWANDVAYSEVFRAQIEGLAKPGDAVVIISASGKSANAVEAAYKRRDRYCVALTGMGGGFLVKACADSVIVESENYGVIEDVHLAICHMLAQSIGDILERDNQ